MEKHSLWSGQRSGEALSSFSNAKRLVSRSEVKCQIVIQPIIACLKPIIEHKKANNNLRTLEVLLLFFLAVVLALDRGVFGRNGLL